MLELVFMGTAAFAVPCLRAAATAHRVLAVVSQPDRPRGRGMALQPTPVKAAAEELGLPVLQPERAADPAFIAQIRELRPDAIIVVAYGQILKPALLEVPPRGCINVHASLLPELRGAAPIQWALLRGDTLTGVTTMQMDAGMDTGDILLQATLAIDPEDTAATLAERLAPLGAELLVETLAEVEAGRAVPRPQDHSRATYAPPLRKEDGAICWGESAEAIRNRIRGCNPWPGAFARREAQVVKLWKARALPDAEGAAPGTVLSAEPLVLATGRGALELECVQPENRARMSGAAYARGYRVAPGEVWRDGL